MYVSSILLLDLLHKFYPLNSVLFYFPNKDSFTASPLWHKISCQLMSETHSMLQFYRLDLVPKDVRAILVIRADTGLSTYKTACVAEDGRLKSSKPAPST